MLCNLAYVKNESRSTALSRLIDAVNRETCKVHNLLQPFEVSNYHLFFLGSREFNFSAALKIGTFSSFTVKRPLCRLHIKSRDGMLKDGRKMSPMHVTLKAGLIYTQCWLVHTRVRVLYRVRNAQSAFYTRVRI